MIEKDFTAQNLTLRVPHGLMLGYEEHLSSGEGRNGDENALDVPSLRLQQ